MSNSLPKLSPEGAVSGSEQDRGSEVERSQELQATASAGAAEFSDRKARLQTFNNCTFETLSPEILADKGYSYLGDDDKIICTGCGESFGSFKPGDDPDTVHEQQKPDCRLLRARKRRVVQQKAQLRMMAEEHEKFLKEIQESKNTLTENEEMLKQVWQELVQTHKMNDRLISDIGRLKRELQEARSCSRSNREAVRPEEEYRALEERAKGQLLEIEYLYDRLKQETADKRMVDSMKETILQQKGEIQNLLTANENLNSVVKQQAQKMERLYLENEELKRNLRENNEDRCHSSISGDRSEGENRALKERVSQLASEIQYLVSAIRDHQIKYGDLYREKKNVIAVLRLQAGEMEKLLEKHKKLRLENEEMKKKLEDTLSIAEEACMEFGYNAEQAKAVSKIYEERTKFKAEELMKILQELEENGQCSQPSDRGQLAVGGQEMKKPVIKLGKVEYPRYASRLDRIQTFRNWPKSSLQHPTVMAEAGFFYSGSDDHARCYCCGICLIQWTPTDEPWFEHAKWSPECGYVRQMKGQEFIDFVQTQVQQQAEVEDDENNPGMQEQENVDVRQSLGENGFQTQSSDNIGQHALLCSPK